MSTPTTRNRAEKGLEAKELVIARVFNAPRELVWKAWTEPDRLARWWGPKGFTLPVCRIDLRKGGPYLYCMRSPEGRDYWSTGIYREIVPMERLVMTDSFADDKGNPVPASYYGMSAEFPMEMTVTVTFEDLRGRTRFTLHHAGIPAGKDQSDCRTGWSESFDKLAEVLKKG